MACQSDVAAQSYLGSCLRSRPASECVWLGHDHLHSACTGRPHVLCCTAHAQDCIHSIGRPEECSRLRQQSILPRPLHCNHDPMHRLAHTHPSLTPVQQQDPQQNPNLQIASPHAEGWPSLHVSCSALTDRQQYHELPPAQVVLRILSSSS